MGTKLSREVALSTVYPVVAVMMDGCQVFHSGIAVISMGVMNLNRIFRVEVKPTFRTFAFLPLDGG